MWLPWDWPRIGLGSPLMGEVVQQSFNVVEPMPAARLVFRLCFEDVGEEQLPTEQDQLRIALFGTGGLHEVDRLPQLCSCIPLR